MGIECAASVGRVYWSHDRGSEERMEGDESGVRCFIGEWEGRVRD